MMLRVKNYFFAFAGGDNAPGICFGCGFPQLFSPMRLDLGFA
jgi:hypothetical protein